MRKCYDSIIFSNIYYITTRGAISNCFFPLVWLKVDNMKMFSKFVENDEVDLTKSEVNSQYILSRCHLRNPDEGGVFTLVTGSQGSGKTSVLISFLNYTLTHHPEEKCFFSNCLNSPIQFPKIGKDRYVIMVEKDSGITFRDRDQHLKQINPYVIVFDGFQDCYDKAPLGVCSAVFFKDRMQWMGFIHFLRGVGEWVNVFIDELSEISPQFQSGETFHQIGRFASDLKETRKCMINIHTNSQSVSDIDPRCRAKAMIRVYLPGARPENTSRIQQKAIDNLTENHQLGNEAYLEYSGKFGKTIFKDIYKPVKNVHWEARLP